MWGVVYFYMMSEHARATPAQQDYTWRDSLVVRLNHDAVQTRIVTLLQQISSRAIDIPDHEVIPGSSHTCVPRRFHTTRQVKR